MSNTTPLRLVSADVELTLSTKKVIAGRLEHSPSARSLVLFDPEELDPILLSVAAGEAPLETAALDADHVLLRGWTEHRGVPEQLHEDGLVVLTGEEVQIGLFRLRAAVARVR
ncbi:hypothetical protein OVA26_16005 [Microbacterium sp. SL62]|uniref:hypothetical protein n=1 Tax=Microbacterium sp. SL62 TaxID=2995139 RepID=UPI0022733978|nr:hypothetical protein [Microbacterium sp. SL62]MCY1718439.1 hypothetical protein [Microbacterium sp. SL62]